MSKTVYVVVVTFKYDSWRDPRISLAGIADSKEEAEALAEKYINNQVECYDDMESARERHDYQIFEHVMN